MSNDIQAMINAALEQKPMEFEEIFGNALRDKLHDAIEARKEEIAQRLFATEEKMAKKDHDGDGKIESGKDEYFGSRFKAAKKAGTMKDSK